MKDSNSSSSIRDDLLLRLAVVMSLIGITTFSSIPFWEWLEAASPYNPNPTIYDAALSLVFSGLCFYFPFFFNNKRGHNGWFASTWETLFYAVYGSIGAVALPLARVAQGLDEIFSSIFFIISVSTAFLLMAWALFRNPVNGNKKSTT